MRIDARKNLSLQPIGSSKGYALASHTCAGAGRNVLKAISQQKLETSLKLCWWVFPNCHFTGAPSFQGSKFKEKTEWNHSKDASEGLLGRRNLTFNIEDIPSDIWSESRICPLRPKGIRAACEQECGFCWPPHSQPLCCYFRSFILSKIVTTLHIVNNLNFGVCCAGHAGGAVDASDGAVKLRRWGDKRLGVQLMTSFIYTMNQYNSYILYTNIYNRIEYIYSIIQCKSWIRLLIVIVIRSKSTIAARMLSEPLEAIKAPGLWLRGGSCCLNNFTLVLHP